MDDPEQYLLQVLRRTQASLQDSLIPFHGEKMKLLTEKLEQASSLKNELNSLREVNGFTKAALSMQWIMARVSGSGEDFSPDQFDVDAGTLSDKLFEAFLSEPFDSPGEPGSASPFATPSAPEPEQDGGAEAVESYLAQPQFEEPVSSAGPEDASGNPADQSPFVSDAGETVPQPEPQPEPEPPSPPPAPALVDLLDQNLLLGFQRFTEIVSKLGEKTPAERKSIFAVLGMIAKSSSDVARAQGKKEILEFFQSVIKFITYVDSSGSAQNSRVAEVMREVGERLTSALKEPTNGAALLQSINEILQNPEGSLTL